MGFLRTLAKVGLVELDETESAPAPASSAEPTPNIDASAIDRILQDETTVTTATSETAASAFADIKPGKLDDIYSRAGVQPSPFPAEKLLKVLEGLKAMDPPMRKAAILAMDAADDAWTVDDAVLDAQRKVRALEQAGQALAQRVAAAESKARTDQEAQDKYQTEAAASIRKQIMDLENLLADEIKKVAEAKSAIDVHLQQTKETATRETARLRAEAERLSEIPRTFAVPNPSKTSRA